MKKHKYSVAEMLENHRGRKRFHCYDEMETAFVDHLLKQNKELRAKLKEATAAPAPHTVYDIPLTVLCTGDKFVASTVDGDREYEFVGLDLQDLKDGIGCSYLVLQPVDSEQEKTCVEGPWFFYRKAHL